MQLNNWISRNTSLTWSQIFDPDTGAVKLISQNGAITIAAWNTTLLGLAQPGSTLLTQITAMPDACSQEVLIDNLYAAQAAALASGITVSVSGVNVQVNGLSSTLANLNSLFNRAVANPSLTQGWIGGNNSVTSMTSAQLISFSTSVNNWVANTYATSATNLSAISNGSITTIAQITAIVWPTN